MLRRAMLRRAMFGAMMVVLGAAGAMAIPGQLSISGQLLDGEGEPVIFTELREDPLTGQLVETVVEKALGARLTFYDAEEGGTLIETLETTATTKAGYFTILFAPTAAMLAGDALFYEVAIDVGMDGIGAEDVFDERFQMASVPFAMTVAPGAYHTVFAGPAGFSNAGSIEQDEDLLLCPFQAPAGGIRFNRIYTYVKGMVPDNRFSVGIYDERGERIVTSALIESHDTTFEGFLEIVCPDEQLQSNSLYYVGLGHVVEQAPEVEPKGRLSFPAIHFPPLPILGYIPDIAPNGEIPESCDLTELVPSIRIDMAPIALAYVDEQSSSPSIRSLSGAGDDERLHWIPDGLASGPDGSNSE